MRLILTAAMVAIGIGVLLAGVLVRAGRAACLPATGDRQRPRPGDTPADATRRPHCDGHTHRHGNAEPRHPQQRPDPAAGLSVENYQTYVDGVAGGLHVIGEIVNGAQVNKSLLRADITLLQNGQPVYNQTQPAMVFSLRPGERAPFDASLGTPPNYTSYTVAANGQTTTTDPVDQFTILSQRTFTETTNTLTLVGELRNDTGGNVTFVTATGTFYQSDGLVWRAAQTYTMLTKLAPGQRSPFKLTAYGPQQIASNALIVRALNSATPPRSDLTVVSSNVTVQGTLLLITGQVRNDGATPASNVQVVASLYDGADQIVNAATSATSTPVGRRERPVLRHLPHQLAGIHDTSRFRSRATDGEYERRVVRNRVSSEKPGFSIRSPAATAGGRWDWPRPR